MKTSTVEQLTKVGCALRNSKGKAVDQNGNLITVVVTAVLVKNSSEEAVVGYSVERPGHLNLIYVDEGGTLRWTELKVVDNITLQGLTCNDLGTFIAERNRITAGLAFSASILSHVNLVANDGVSWSVEGVFDQGEMDKLLAQMKRNRSLWYPTSAYIS